MKKRMKKLAGLLMAIAMVCIPVTESLAAVSYDALGGVYDEILFPGDSVININEEFPVIVNGEGVALETPGTWTNDTKGRVYSATMAEDGTLIVDKIGSLLTIENGTSVKAEEGADNSRNHYHFPDGEEPEVPQDIAFYQSGETVRIIAAEPKEGKQFAGWTVSEEGGSVADPSSPDTTYVMGEKRATITANYEDIPAEEPAPEEIPADEYAEPVPEEIIDQENQGIGEATVVEIPGEGSYVEIPANDTAEVAVEEIQPVEENVENSFVEIPTPENAENSYVEIPSAGNTDAAVEIQPGDGTGLSVENLNEEVQLPEGTQLSDITVDFSQPEFIEIPAVNPEAPAENPEAPVENPEIPADNSDIIQVDPPVEPDLQNDPPEPITYDLTVEYGTVTNPSETGKYANGTEISVTASDRTAENLQFSGWTTAPEGLASDLSAGTITFTMPESAVSLTANYQPIPPTTYTITVTGGVDGNNAVSGAYSAGSTVTVKATPAPNQLFTGWSGIKTATSEVIVFTDAASAETTFTMPEGDVTVTANYSVIPAKYNVTVANGTITDRTPISEGIWEIEENTVVTLTANPNPAGQAFAGWSITDAAGNAVDPAAIGVDPYSSTIYPTITQPFSFIAQYQGVSYSVIVTNGAANYTTAVSGTVVTISASQAPAGTKFAGWTVTSGNVSLADASSATTTFVMPTADVTVAASYKTASYSLTVKHGNSDKDTYKAGAEPTIRANYPESGEEFDYWEAVSGDVDFYDEEHWKTSFEMPASDVVVKAVYKYGPSTDNNEILDIVHGGEYYTGTAIRFTASGAGMNKKGKNPGDYRYIPVGYQIGNVTGNWNSEPYTTSMSIKAAGEYVLKVTFKKQMFDGNQWIDDGTTDVKSVTFRVIPNTSVNTGDDTPLQSLIAIAAGSCVLFLILLIVFIRRRKRK